MSRIAILVLCGLGGWCVALSATALDAPTLSHEPVAVEATAGKPATVAYEVRWTGPADTYALFPFEPDPVSWGEARILSADSFSDGDTNAVRYELEYVAAEPGTYETSGFRIAYGSPEAFTPLEEGEEATEIAAPGLLRGEAIPVEVSPALNLVYVGIGGAAVVVALALGGMAIAMRRRRRSTAPAGHASGPPTTIQGVVNLAKAHRLDGKLYEYYRELARGASLLGSMDAAKALRDRLEKDAERIGYGALEPTEDELDGAMRDLERVARESNAGQNE